MEESKIETGGQAFPGKQIERDDNEVHEYSHEGMTLRDYFAGQVIGNLIDYKDIDSGHHNRIFMAAKYAYRIADEMICARKRVNP